MEYVFVIYQLVTYKSKKFKSLYNSVVLWVTKGKKPSDLQSLSLQPILKMSTLAAVISVTSATVIAPKIIT